MKVIKTEIEGVVILEPEVFADERGHFFESFSQREFEQKVCGTVFVQDNESLSLRRGVIRGLHYQLPPMAQGKLVRVVRGVVLDVAVDIRRGSPTFGRHIAVELSDENRRQLFVPRGFAHGYAVLSDDGAVFQYKCDNYYSRPDERGIRFDDPILRIDWKVGTAEMILSEKDRALPGFEEAEVYDFSEKLY